MGHDRVASLAKDPAIGGGMRLVLAHFIGSE
jgi:hypothetical protein